MTKKKKSTAPTSTVPAAPARNPNVVLGDKLGLNFAGKTKEERTAELVFSAALTCAVTATATDFARPRFGEDLQVTEAAIAIINKAEAICKGDLTGAETMLFAQATALGTIFEELARRACLNMGQHLPAMETYLRLAFKAQSQCRTTLETLAEIKNPRQPATFVKQQNLAHNQQVNNTLHAGAGNLEKRQTNYWREALTHGWTPKRKTKQAAAIQRWKPWAKSTGAKTQEGKAASSQNARKHGLRSQQSQNEMKALRDLMRRFKTME